jgi:hypothetical protein
MIVKIYIEKATKTKRVGGRRGLTLVRIVFCHNKNFRRSCPKRERNHKNRARSDAATVLPYLGSRIIRRIRNGDVPF